jgi:hypothetical protein
MKSATHWYHYTNILCCVVSKTLSKVMSYLKLKVTLVTVIKSGPKNIDFTPSTLNSSLHNGDRYAACPFGKSIVSPEPNT